jgi:8-hydroxy-5-deazaflavin:NADPH oxidoreductase
VRITVVGAGAVGRALMSRLADAHEVTLGARDPAGESATAAAAELGGRVRLASLDDALTGPDAVIVAIPGGQIPAFIAGSGDRLDGTLVIDASNDRTPSGALNHVADWQQQAPGAIVARAFCTLGWENVADPAYDGVPATMFWCGPDGDAAEAVETIVRDTGLDPVRIGGLEAADTLDGVTRLWFQLAFTQGMGRRIGFRLLR